MKNLVLKVKHSNWGMMGPGDWNNTEWNIYDDLTVDIKVLYNPKGGIANNQDYSCELEENNYKTLLQKIEEAKLITDVVDACDGSAWEYTQYQNGNEVWKRDNGYIYGIKPLEEIAIILNNLIKN